jgi:hypothetical protein
MCTAAHVTIPCMQVRGMEEGDVQVQAALDGLVQLDAVDMLREALLTALEPQVCLHQPAFSGSPDQYPSLRHLNASTQ